MQDENSRRSLSPYHEKCFPPYCENAQQVDKAAVSKMGRDDLEDKYIIFADENLSLKKQIRNHERHIQRLQTAMQRQDYLDKRSGRTPTSAVTDCNKIAILEAQNKNLQAKLKVLKQQLMNHSFIHSKENRIADAKMRQGKTSKDPVSSEFPNQTQSAREAKPDRNVVALKMRIAELEEELEKQKNKFKARIAQLEKELATLEKELTKSGTNVTEQISETTRQVNDNKEMIRLRMQAEKDAAELADLREKLKAALAEVEELRKELKEAKDRIDDLEKQLDEERNKSRTILSKVSKESGHGETIRVLEEQIRDLQNEKQTLKETNEKLLELTQTKSEKQPSGHSLKISQLEKDLKDKMDELEEKDTKIKDLEQRIQELEEKLAELQAIPQKKVPSTTSKGISPVCSDSELKNMKAEIARLQKELDDLREEKSNLEKELNNSLDELNTLRPKVAEHENVIKSLRSEIERLKEELDALREDRAKLEKQLSDALNEQNALRPMAAAHEYELKTLRDEIDRLQKELDALKEERAKLEEQLNDALNEKNAMQPLTAEQERELQNLKEEIDRLQQELDDLREERAKLEKNLYDSLHELNALRPIVAEHEYCRRTPVPSAHSVKPITSSKSVQNPSYFPSPVQSATFNQVIPVYSFATEQHVGPSESVHSKNTVDSERYIALTRQLQEALWENERLRKALEDSKADEVLRRQNQRLEDDLTTALRELRELRPIAEEHRYCQVHKEVIKTEKEYVVEQVAPPPIYQASSEHSARISQKSSERGRAKYVSHVTPPPSLHCVETVDVNDPAQRANLLIVSKHDFETVLMKKKKYSTEMEVMEPLDGKQTLNCKLEICMYDLDIEDRMLEYLSSIQASPKVYVDWSFVGLDQRTAPLPAEQALFYTNVVYYGPLSNEIKAYLRKSEMPIDLYLVKSSGHPVKVAEGRLDMLPAMEQPNRGFMRSVFLWGKDLPNRCATDKAVATIHCSFILHECCLGDPPFKDQLEVAIGTLYLKNRDGGVVPDHATHIYIEYSLLGYCGPDLETDSVPRGEVMKFNHSKKLMVNDENAPHLKSMLQEHNTKPLRFTVLAEPCNLLSDTEVETVGHADVNLNEEMIKKDRDLVSSQVPVYSNDGEHLGTLSVTVLGVNTLQQYAEKQRIR